MHTFCGKMEFVPLRYTPEGATVHQAERTLAACSALSRRRRPTVTQFPVTRCQICQRTVACRPGALSQTLTDDYRRVHPERWASPPSNTRITRPGEGRTRSCP